MKRSRARAPLLAAASLVGLLLVAAGWVWTSGSAAQAPTSKTPAAGTGQAVDAPPDHPTRWRFQRGQPRRAEPVASTQPLLVAPDEPRIKIKNRVTESENLMRFLLSNIKA